MERVGCESGGQCVFILASSWELARLSAPDALGPLSPRSSSECYGSGGGATERALQRPMPEGARIEAGCVRLREESFFL